MTSYIKLKNTLLGNLLLVANQTHLIGVYFSDCNHVPALETDWQFNQEHPVLQQAGRELDEFAQGTRTRFSVPIHYDGTSFQHEIWRQIALIPFGKTITYTELAQRAGAPTALRAAGTATGKNPLSVIIPCHRVVGKSGGMGGYAGGLDRKRKLLKIEMNTPKLDREQECLFK